MTWISETIDEYYAELIQYGLTYNDLYDMTLYELSNTLINLRKGLGYRLWKQAVLFGETFNENFPKTPEEANPELFPPKKRYKMPDWVKTKYYARGMR